MTLYVTNKDRFPHYYMLKQLGEETEKGRWYNLRYSQALNKEYEVILENAIDRFNLGGTKIVHKIIEDEFSHRESE